MRAVLRLAAHSLRARWRGWVFLALLVGLAGGAVLTAAAGARRTDSAYPRFLEASKAADVLVSPTGSGLGGNYDALSRLPDVAAIAPFVGLDAGPVEPGGKAVGATVTAALDGRFGHLLETPKMLAGRQPSPDRPGEVVVNQIAAADLHLRVGSRLELGASAGSDVRHVRLLSERVVGIMVTRGSIVPVTETDRTPIILASPALLHELGPSYEGYVGAFVKLRPGSTPSSFSRPAQALARRFPATGGQVIVADEDAQAVTVERSIRPQAVALALFALALALAALLIVGQVASRLLLAASRGNGTLAALGMTRTQLLAAALAEVGVAAAAGAAVACGVAIAASPLMPIGPARLAEPDPGVSVDIAVLAGGFAAIVALLVARVAWPAWRQASVRPADERDAATASSRRSLAAEWLARAGAPVTAVTGVRLALDPGRGRTAVPVRSALVGLAVAVAAVSAAVTFGTNLLRLVDTPQLYGQGWDLALDLQFSTITPQQFDRLAARVPGIAGWTFGFHGTDQRPNAVTGYALIDGTPEVLAGILAVLALAVLGQFVVASARRRRHDFAVMKVLGLLRRQLTAVSGWQVSTLTALALLVGLPLGVAGGRWAWDLFATNVGLPPGAITPVPLLWMIPATLAVANVIALGPGRQAARLSPAAVLRAE